MKFLNLNRVMYRLRVAVNVDAWILILVGLALFTIRIPLNATGWIEWPVAATVFQTAGLMFMLFGLIIQASMFMWPQIDLKRLILEVKSGNIAAGIVVAALLIFCGLGVIALTIWLTGALGAGVVAK